MIGPAVWFWLGSGSVSPHPLRVLSGWLILGCDAAEPDVVIDGLIDSPGTRALPRAQQHPEVVMNPVKIAEAFYYLHTQDKSCWTHELQLTPFATKPSF